MSSIKKIRELCDDLDFKKELHATLCFVLELIEVSHGYVSLIGTNETIIKAVKNFDFLVLPENLICLNNKIVHDNKILVVNIKNNATKFKVTDKDLFFPIFFAGLPIITKENLVVGTLCILDENAKELSKLQLKSLQHAALQIGYLLDVYFYNKTLKEKLRKQEDQFELFTSNSNEIFYEIDFDGIITLATGNLKRLLGYEVKHLIGKRLIDFIHPEDIEKYILFFQTLTLEVNKQESITYRIRDKKGSYVWHSCSVKLIEREGVQLYYANCRDIPDYANIKQKLLIQKEFYEKILDQVPTDIAVFDENQKYIYLNTAAIKNDELRAFIIGKDDFEYAKFTGRDDLFAKKRHSNFSLALKSKEVIEWEDSIQIDNGQLIFYTRKFAPVFRADGTLEMMVGFGIDITESKSIQQENLQSKLLTNSIIQNAGAAIIVQGPQSEIVKYNKAACEMLGLTEEQLFGKNSFDKQWKVIHSDGTFFDPYEFPASRAIQKLKPINAVVMGIYQPLHNDLVWLLVDAIPVLGATNELLYVITSFNDITAQINAEDALKISNERYFYSSKATSDALWDWNILKDEVVLGESYSSLFGYQFENSRIKKLVFDSFIHQDDLMNYNESISKALNSTVDRWSCEYRYLKLYGDHAHVKDKAIIIRNDKGEAIRMIGAMQDITKEKNLKNKLLQSEQYFKGAFHHAAAGMAIVNLEGHFIEVNDRLSEILGYTKEEFKILKREEITHFDDLAKNALNKEKLIAGVTSNFTIETRYKHKSNFWVWTHISVSLIRNKGGEIQHFIKQITDISARKKIEEQHKLLIDDNNRNKTLQLDKAKSLYQLLADNMIDLVCLHNIDTSFLYVSPSVKKILGYEPKDLIGKFPGDFLHPEDARKIEENGRSIIFEDNNTAVTLRFINITGQYVWVECKAILVLDKGVPISFQSSTRDITQRKKTEEIVANTLMQERELNELRSNLVSTISHEFRTPMTIIRASAEFIALFMEVHKFPKSTHVEKKINIITGEIDRIVELMNAVLTISKDDSGKTDFYPVKFDLKQLCIDAIESSCRGKNYKRKVTTSFYGQSFVVFADKKLMEHSIVNILNNAFKYSDILGDVMLNMYNRDGILSIEIIDFGIGIPAEDQSKLFNTFFRASNTSGFSGTGLGLYIVKTFTKKNSGTVHLESCEGKGTTVILTFLEHNNKNDG